VRFGSYAANVIRDGRLMKQGSFITRSPDEIRVGQIQCTDGDGVSLTIHWEDAAADPGWCKLDWAESA